MINDKSINWNEKLPKIVKEETFETKPSNQNLIVVDICPDFKIKRIKLELLWNGLAVTLLPSVENRTPAVPLIVVVGLEPIEQMAKHLKAEPIEGIIKHFSAKPIAILKNPSSQEMEHLLNNGITAN